MMAVVCGVFCLLIALLLVVCFILRGRLMRLEKYEQWLCKSLYTSVHGEVRDLEHACEVALQIIGELNHWRRMAHIRSLQLQGLSAEEVSEAVEFDNNRRVS